MGGINYCYLSKRDKKWKTCENQTEYLAHKKQGEQVKTLRDKTCDTLNETPTVLTDEQKQQKAEDCGHSSWVDYKNSGWKCERTAPIDDTPVVVIPGGRYRDCTGGPYSKGCTDTEGIISKVQGCLGTTVDGKFYTKTEDALMSKTGKKTFTKEDVSKICSGTPPEGEGIKLFGIDEQKKYWEDLKNEGQITTFGTTITNKNTILYVYKKNRNTGSKEKLTSNDINLLKNWSTSAEIKDELLKSFDIYDYIVLHPIHPSSGKNVDGQVSVMTAILNANDELTISTVNAGTWKPSQKIDAFNYEESNDLTSETIRKILKGRLIEQNVTLKPGIRSSSEPAKKGTDIASTSTSSIQSTSGTQSTSGNISLDDFGLNKANGINDPIGILTKKTPQIQDMIDKGAKSDYFNEWNKLLPKNVTKLINNEGKEINDQTEWETNSPKGDVEELSKYTQMTFGGLLNTDSKLQVFVPTGSESYTPTKISKTSPEKCKESLIQYLVDGLQKRSGVPTGGKCFICNCNASGSYDKYKETFGEKIQIGGKDSEFGTEEGSKLTRSMSPYRSLLNRKLNWKEIINIIRGQDFKTTEGETSRINPSFIITKFDDPTYSECNNLKCSTNVNESLNSKVKKHMVKAIGNKKNDVMVESILNDIKRLRK